VSNDHHDHPEHPNASPNASPNVDGAGAGASSVNTNSKASPLDDPATGGLIIFFIVLAALIAAGAAVYAYRAFRAANPKMSEMRASGRMGNDGQILPSHGDAIDISAPLAGHEFSA
jgi:hypothetical protein